MYYFQEQRLGPSDQGDPLNKQTNKTNKQKFPPIYVEGVGLFG